MKHFILLLPILLISCVNHDKNEEDIFTKESVDEKKIFSEHKLQIYTDFSEFWLNLGNAIKNNDTVKLKSFINIPLEILGREDNDPRYSADENNAIDAFLFSIYNGGYYDSNKDISVSNKELLLSKLDEIQDYKPSSKEQWINDFVFVLTKDGWKLKTLYLDTKTYKLK